jgi:hypothetical protein
MTTRNKITKLVNSKKTKGHEQIAAQEDSERRQREAVMHINLNIQHTASNADIKKDLATSGLKFTRISNNTQQNIYAKATDK